MAEEQLSLILNGYVWWLTLPLAALLCLAMIRLYSRETETFRATGKWLRVIRAGVILFLVLMLSQPTLFQSHARFQAPMVIVLSDISPSMSVRDTHDRPEIKIRKAIKLGLLDGALRDTRPEQAGDHLLSVQERLEAASSACRRALQRMEESGGDLREARGLLASAIEELGEVSGTMGKALKFLGASDTEALVKSLETGLRNFVQLTADFREVDLENADASSVLGDWISRLRSARTDVERMAIEAGKWQTRLDLALATGKTAVVEKALENLDAMTRADVVEQMLKRSLGTLKGDSLGRIVYSFDTDLRMNKGSSAGPGDPAEDSKNGASKEDTHVVDRDETDLTTPLLRVVERHAKDNISAVILCSDGRHTSGPLPEEAARALAARAIPLYTLGVGSVEPPVDICLARLEASPSVFLDETIYLAAHIKTVGCNGQHARLTLKRDDKVMEEREIKLGIDGWRRERFEMQADRSGTNLYVATVQLVSLAKKAPQPPAPGLTADGGKVSDKEAKEAKKAKKDKKDKTDKDGDEKSPQTAVASIGPITEALAGNNQAEALVDVANDRLKVLLIDSLPRRETRFMASLLRRERRIQLDERWLLTNARLGVRPLALPEGEQPLNSYDVVVLGDVPPDRLDFRMQQQLAKYVEERGGFLVVIAGQDAMPRSYLTGPMADILPISQQSNQSSAVPVDASRAPAHVRLRLHPDAVRHEIVRIFRDPTLNEQLWPDLPELHWIARPAYPKPGATVLLYADDARRDAVVAVHYYGSGRVLYVGTDEAWRSWRLKLADRVHAFFWSQALRWGTSDRLIGDARLKVGLSRSRIQPGDAVEVLARPRDRAGRILKDAVVTAELDDKTHRNRVQLQSVQGSGGLYRGILQDIKVGTHQILVSVDAPGGDNLKQKIDVVALEIAGQEGVDLSRDTARLAGLAAEGGGSYRDITAAGELFSQLVGQGKEETVEDSYELWASYPALLLVVALLILEWTLRKRIGLA